MASSASVAPMPPSLTREEVVPSRKRIKLPPWLEVAKPRLIPLLLATTLGGMALTEGWPLSSPRLACTLGGGALAAAAAGVLNCLWEQELDGRMLRTSGRALPSGRLSPSAAFIGAVSCTLAAAALLVSGVNCLAAGLSLLGLCSYVLLYTALLKPRTTQNIVVGGVAGAIPPLVGAAAACFAPREANRNETPGAHDSRTSGTRGTCASHATADVVVHTASLRKRHQVHCSARLSGQKERTRPLTSRWRCGPRGAARR